MRRSQAGFSLVELMISTGLFGVIVSGAMSLVISGVRMQDHSARLNVAESGLRAGLDFMSRDILSASAGAKSGTLMIAASGALVQPIVVVDGGANGSDTLEIYGIDAGYTATVAGSVTSAATGIPIVLNDSNFSFGASDLVQLCDLTSGVLVQLSGATTTLLTATLGNFPAGLTSFNAGSSYVFKVRHVKYSIAATQYGSTLSGNGSVLMMDVFDGNGPQPLAEGVEDLQVALAIDANADGLIAAEKGAAGNDDEWVFNHVADTAPVNVANLKAVRVTLIAKSTTAEKGSFPARPAAEDHTAGAARDGFFRRVVRTQIAVRNFNI